MTTPLEAFEGNMDDAERLVAYARALTNRPARRFRAELRSLLGEALRIRQRDLASIDGLESDELFVGQTERKPYSR